MRSVFCGAYTGKTLLAGYVVEGENECMEYKETILIVDDSALNRMVLIEILGKENYTFLEAENGQQAVELLDCHPEVDLLLLDITMPEIDGFGVLEIMNQYHWIEETPVIMISAEDSYTFVERAYDLGASDYITRPFDARVVCRRVSNTLMLYAKQKRLVQMVAEQVYEKEKVSNTMISILSHIVEFRNNESGLHVVHIRTITELLLRRLRKKTDRYPLTEADISLISTASALHDIGKINIPEQILNKPGRLTKEEFEIIKTHSAVGEHMLRQIPFNQNEPLVKVAREICRWHHERWDGRGYPDGLKGDEIPISAQVVSLADVYDALTSERCYKAAFDHETALNMIVNGECGAFNPLLLECLMDGADQIKQTMQETEEEKQKDAEQSQRQEANRLSREVLQEEGLLAGREKQGSARKHRENAPKTSDNSQDWEAAFRAAHTLKGVAQNLGFQKLYLSSTALTEALRGPKPLTDPALREAVAMDQAALLTAIQELEG